MAQNGIFHIYFFFVNFDKGAVLKTLKKLSFNEKFDYELIYPSNDDAVHSILLKAAQQEENLVTMSEPSTSAPDFDVFDNIQPRLNAVDEHPARSNTPAAAGYHNNACVSIDIEEPSSTNQIDRPEDTDKEIEYPMSVYRKRAESDFEDILD